MARDRPFGTEVDRHRPVRRAHAIGQLGEQIGLFTGEETGAENCDLSPFWALPLGFLNPPMDRVERALPAREGDRVAVAVRPGGAQAGRGEPGGELVALEGG